MSAMSELALEIEERLHKGLSADAIAQSLDIPLEWVLATEEAIFGEQGYDDSMDGDHASALASAGFGTDEDYGSFCEEY